MQLEELTPEVFRRAVEIYMRHAWPDAEAARPLFDPACLATANTLPELFALCECAESNDDAPLFKRYVLRLGNAKYAFMKFVVQEYLVHGEYFFSVDTHDEVVRAVPGAPDYAACQQLREENRGLKLEIESAWDRAELPTHHSLRLLLERLAKDAREEGDRGRVIVVDDEKEVALGLAALLAAKGYRAETAYDGRQILERLDRDPLPDVVILDYAMPEYDGQEVLERIRSNERTRDLSVLLATASSIELERMQRVSGLLRKPYPVGVLLALLERLVGEQTRSRS